MAWGCVSGYWTQPCQQCPCLENSTNVQSHDTALLGVPKKSKTLSCHSKTGKVGPKSFKQEDKPQVSSISCASVKNMVPTCSSVLPEVPELDREVKTDEYKNKKNILLFPSLNSDTVLVDKISENYRQPLLRTSTGGLFSANLQVQQERGVYVFWDNKKKHCKNNVYCWWGWFLDITCSRNRPWTSKGYIGTKYFLHQYQFEKLWKHKCKSLLCH